MRGFADICAVEAKALGQQQGGAFEALAGDAPHFDAALLLVFGTGDSASAGFSCGGEGFACLGVSGFGLAERGFRSELERKSVVEGKGVSVRVDIGGRRIIKQKKD